jgi:hypothetical protein
VWLLLSRVQLVSLKETECLASSPPARQLPSQTGNLKKKRKPLKKLSQLLLIGLGLGISAVALSTIPSTPASASGGAAVTVINTPLPVTGSVSAAQSGTWNVGVTGTPNVNVANSPTVSIGNTPSVNATQTGTWDVGISGNTSTNPLFVRDIDNPAKQPFVSSCSISFSTPQGNNCQFITVPVGKQLVIEVFAVFIQMQVGDRPVETVLVGTQNGSRYVLPYPQSFNGPSGASDAWVVSQPLTRAYADPNTTPFCEVGANPSEAIFANCTISGYLVNLP